MKELIERLEKHKKTCQEWRLAEKGYDENSRVPFFCSEVDTKQIIKALELMENYNTVIELLKQSRCPDTSCDNYGTLTIAVRGQDGWPEPEPAQCQWCYDREAVIEEYEKFINQNNQ